MTLPEQLPRILATQVLFDHPGVRIVIDVLEWETERQRYFYMQSPIEAVATLGVTEDNQVLLTRQYRHPIREVIYDLPAGRLNPNELPLEGARREFEEETGYLPRHIEPLGRYNQFPGMLRAYTNLFFARDLQATQQHLDPGEVLEVVKLPVSQVLQMVLQGEIIDGSLQIGLLMALQKKLIQL